MSLGDWLEVVMFSMIDCAFMLIRASSEYKLRILVYKLSLFGFIWDDIINLSVKTIKF